jgi:protein PhnA
MSLEQKLRERSGSLCELCAGTNDLKVYPVGPEAENSDHSILVCSACLEQIEDATKINIHHWHCLNNSMWSPVPAVQVITWRLLNVLKKEGWPQDLLDKMYLEEETLAWARVDERDTVEVKSPVHKDSNGTVLSAGDTVVLIKDLDVKGGGFTAKRGTAVRGISLVENDPEHIEARVNGQQIVILTRFVKKSG